MIGTYYTVSVYSNENRCYCLAFKSKKNALKEIEEDYNQSLEDRHFGQILKVEPDYEITDEYDEEGNIIVKRGRKKQPKMIGFDCTCKGNITLAYILGEEEGDIDELEAIDRFSDDKF